MSRSMKATIFVKPGRIELQERPIPDIGPLDALVRVTTTTICGTEVHIMKGEYPVRSGLIIGHEPVRLRAVRQSTRRRIESGDYALRRWGLL